MQKTLVKYIKKFVKYSNNMSDKELFFLGLNSLMGMLISLMILDMLKAL